MLRLALMCEARAATKIVREVPLAANAAAGRVQGKAGLLFERGGEWRVVDFKTDRLTTQTIWDGTRSSSRSNLPTWLMS